MSARRQARAAALYGGSTSTGVPRELTRFDDPLWSDPAAVDDWRAVHGLPSASRLASGDPTSRLQAAIRDYARVEGLMNSSYENFLDHGRLRALGVPTSGFARRRIAAR